MSIVILNNQSIICDNEDIELISKCEIVNERFNIICYENQILARMLLKLRNEDLIHDFKNGNNLDYRKENLVIVKNIRKV